MFEKYIFVNGQRLRCGYTTGSCAAAAAGAAAEMLLTGKIVRCAEIITPKGVILDLDTEDPFIGSDHASCKVLKDSGDDPDITNGISVCADVYLSEYGVEISGGEGVGLDRPVGDAAINSVPRKMITDAVMKAVKNSGYTGGLRVVISVPEGKKIAEKTYNPRMGIVGGISIIGTSGIVEPMSTSAIIETVRTEARMRRARGKENLLLTIGNYSENFVGERFPALSDAAVKCSNFIGEAIDAGIELGFRRILIIGHLGKLVKLGAGIMNTHSSCADGRMEILAFCAIAGGADIHTLNKLTACATVDAALDILRDPGALEKTLEVLSDRMELYLKAKVKGNADIGALAFSPKQGVIVKTKSADGIIDKISEEENG